MLEPGRKYNSASAYRYGFNGQEKSQEIDTFANLTTAKFWEYDTRTGLRWNIDPIGNPYTSPYAAFNRNPILHNDALGDEVSSTHTDEKGNVVAIKNDGDLGVYKHKGDMAQALQEINKLYNYADNTSAYNVDNNIAAGGQKVGETLTPYGFAADFNINYSLNAKGSDIKPAVGAKIDFGSQWASDRANDIISYHNPTWMEYGIKARGGGEWDIKTKAPGLTQGAKAFYGSLLFGKYASARDAGNFIAGAVQEESVMPNGFFEYGYGTYNLSNNSAPISLLRVERDFILLAIPPLLPMGLQSVKNAMNGEVPQSQTGIDAGKAYIKNLQDGNP